jgi:hypothetical protein
MLSYDSKNYLIVYYRFHLNSSTVNCILRLDNMHYNTNKSFSNSHKYVRKLFLLRAILMQPFFYTYQ